MKRTKGISLIVLVVTIIVMIIIAGAIMLSLTQTNVIDQAEMATDKYNLSQLKESINLERTNALLARYNTTENVNISVKELLGLTDSDAINISATNTMSANVPEGKYYKLDVTKYGMQNTGTVENNIIKGVYVINDNYDIYYIIEGTIETVKEIDDGKVTQCLMELLSGGNEQELVEQLKQELYIEDEGATAFTDIAFVFSDNEIYHGRSGYCYFYTIDRLYFMNTETMQPEYADKNEKTSLYELAAKLQQIRQELELVFVGKTKTEMEAKHNDGVLEEYILDNCTSIKAIEFSSGSWWSTHYIIDEIVFDYGNNTIEDFCSCNSFEFYLDENGKYTKVVITPGA